MTPERIDWRLSRPVSIRQPEPDETPLSPAEMWVAIREGVRPVHLETLEQK